METTTNISTRCPECEGDNLLRRVDYFPVCPTCEWTGWSKDTDATIGEPYDFSADDEGWTHDPQRDGAGCSWCGAWAKVNNENLCRECDEAGEEDPAAIAAGCLAAITRAKS